MIDVGNWHYQSVCIRDAARDVLARKLSLEEAAKQYNVPQEWIECKVLDPQFEPPKVNEKKVTALDRLRETPAEPRHVLTKEEKQLKHSFIDKLQKKRLHHTWVQCIVEAAREVHFKMLTLRAASEKYDVKPEDVQHRLKDNTWVPEAPLTKHQRKFKKKSVDEPRPHGRGYLAGTPDNPSGMELEPDQNIGSGINW